MDDSFNFGRRRRDYSSFFSPLANKTNSSLRRECNNDSTPTSSRTGIAATTEIDNVDSLIQAIESRDADSFAEVLLTSQSVDVNRVIPEIQMTLLHYSVGNSENEPYMVEELLRMGGDPNNVNIEGKESPLHLSAYFDYDRVMRALVEHGGDLSIRNGEGETCYDIVRRNVEEELFENCFKYLFPISRAFRKSMGTCLSGVSHFQSKLGNNSSYKKQEKLHESGSDGFYSCESQLASEANSQLSLNNDRIHSIARRLYPLDYTNLMTEDESVDASDDDEVRKKLTTIPEESGVCSVVSPQLPAFASLSTSPQRRYRGIGSMTAPLYCQTDDSISVLSDISESGSGPSCVNSTPPITPQPTTSDLERLKQQMKQLNIPVTPSTYGVISKFSECENRMQVLLTPKTGSKNFSPELQAGIQDINLIHEWGNLKVDFLQNATPTANCSKSFYNYLLLDPRVTKRVNFSGNHLKAGIINNTEKFVKFLESVFYIGKAHGKRPLQHLVEAKQKYVEMGRKTLKNGEKIDRILEIWKSGLGVIIVSVFHHSSEREANVNEACMIDAMGLVELSNLKKGSYAGTVAASWPQKTKNQLGSLLLLNSFRTFVVNDPKQFYPQDF